MADLNYNDMQRAVQDGVRQLQSDVQRIMNGMNNVAQASERIDDIERTVLDMQRNLQMIQNNLASMRPGGNLEQRMVSLGNDMIDLKARFTAVERFAAQMSDYMRERYEEEREDRQYRSA